MVTSTLNTAMDASAKFRQYSFCKRFQKGRGGTFFKKGSPTNTSLHIVTTSFSFLAPHKVRENSRGATWE